MKQIKNKKYWGGVCEEIAVNYLKRKGFEIVDRNYNKKCGEIDIVTKRAGVIHFIEVKGVIHETSQQKQSRPDGATRDNVDVYRPEDRLSTRKLSRLKRTIQVYLAEKQEKGTDCLWSLDAVLIHLCLSDKSAKAIFMENILE